MGHPDFRVGGKIFATLGPDEERAMVKLPVDLQKSFVSYDPEVFQPASGAWGRRGSTIVRLSAANELAVRQALIAAWRSTAPNASFDSHSSPARDLLLSASLGVVQSLPKETAW